MAARFIVWHTSLVVEFYDRVFLLFTLLLGFSFELYRGQYLGWFVRVISVK